VTGKDQDHPIAGDMTSVLQAVYLQAPDRTKTAPGAGPPAQSALLVVQRGPNVGSRFDLDQAVTSAGRDPDSDLFLDDVTVSRRYAELRVTEDTTFTSSMLAASKEPTSTTRRLTRRRGPTAMRCNSASSALSS
jgi:pSer/pThr/pTyr-binding forkhead associated (FHA) protein